MSRTAGDYRVRPVHQPAEVPDQITARLRSLCLALPETYEEAAWVGTRWMIRKRNFAHVLTIVSGRPQAYARAAGTDGPACVLTFRCPADEVDAFRNAGAPFFVPVWFPNIVGILLDGHTRWNEVSELLTESYCGLAPRRLADLVHRPTH